MSNNNQSATPGLCNIDGPQTKKMREHHQKTSLPTTQINPPQRMRGLILVGNFHASPRDCAALENRPTHQHRKHHQHPGIHAPSADRHQWYTCKQVMPTKWHLLPQPGMPLKHMQPPNNQRIMYVTHRRCPCQPIGPCGIAWRYHHSGYIPNRSQHTVSQMRMPNVACDARRQIYPALQPTNNQRDRSARQTMIAKT